MLLAEYHTHHNLCANEFNVIRDIVIFHIQLVLITFKSFYVIFRYQSHDISLKSSQCIILSS